MVGLPGQVRGLLESHIIGLAAAGDLEHVPGWWLCVSLRPPHARPALTVTKEAVFSMAAARSAGGELATQLEARCATPSSPSSSRRRSRTAARACGTEFVAVGGTLGLRSACPV